MNKYIALAIMLVVFVTGWDRVYRCTLNTEQGVSDCNGNLIYSLDQNGQTYQIYTIRQVSPR